MHYICEIWDEFDIFKKVNNWYSAELFFIKNNQAKSFKK